MSPQVVLSFAMKPCGNAVAPREIGRHTLHRVVSHSLNSGPSDWPGAPAPQDPKIASAKEASRSAELKSGEWFVNKTNPRL